MAKQTTPHRNTEQDVDPTGMDLEPGQLDQEVGRGADAKLYEDSGGAQTGGTRAFNANQPQGAHNHTEQPAHAHEGNMARMTPTHEGQGITNRSANEEASRNRKVVSEREDAKAGTNVNLLKKKSA